MQKIPLGIVHGRFQPPHNGHIRFMQEAFNRAEHVIIGICTPAICTEEEAERTGYPCAPHMNPFTHQERIEMITLALTDVGILKEQFSFIPFPSDYQNIEVLVPKDSVFFMSVTSEHDQRKITYLESRGFHIETIFPNIKKTKTLSFIDCFSSLRNLKKRANSTFFDFAYAPAQTNDKAQKSTRVSGIATPNSSAGKENTVCANRR